uniref:C2 domain-containing protein n=2 Tax=Clytia hemisphaerica TaxID=252671 RepID=A0A7M5V9H2_9CNID
RLLSELDDIDKESSLASVSILLCHQATYNKLEVTVQKACNLPRIGMGGQPSTYATVQLFKEDSVDKKDIVVKRNSRDPVFKEMVEFDVNIDANCPLSRYSLVISLIHKAGIVGRDEILGHVIFSISSPQKSAAEHWKFICDTPHQHLEQSHSLVDPDELLNSNESSST